jgi:hypothetical protein
MCTLALSEFDLTTHRLQDDATMYVYMYIGRYIHA